MTLMQTLAVIKTRRIIPIRETSIEEALRKDLFRRINWANARIRFRKLDFYRANSLVNKPSMLLDVGDEYESAQSTKQEPGTILFYDGTQNITLSDHAEELGTFIEEMGKLHDEGGFEEYHAIKWNLRNPLIGSKRSVLAVRTIPDEDIPETKFYIQQKGPHFWSGYTNWQEITKRLNEKF